MDTDAGVAGQSRADGIAIIGEGTDTRGIDGHFGIHELALAQVIAGSIIILG